MSHACSVVRVKLWNRGSSQLSGSRGVASMPTKYAETPTGTTNRLVPFFHLKKDRLSLSAPERALLGKSRQNNYSVTRPLLGTCVGGSGGTCRRQESIRGPRPA